MGKERNNKNKRISKFSLKKNGKPQDKVANIASANDFRKKKQNKQKNNVYYSFLTIILLICLIQVGFSAILNISKTISYHNKITTIKKIRDEAEVKNNQLRKELREFSSTSSLEAIARNNLKMASEDEVLIIINKTKQEQKKVKSKNIFGKVKNDK